MGALKRMIGDFRSKPELLPLVLLCSFASGFAAFTSIGIPQLDGVTKKTVADDDNAGTARCTFSFTMSTASTAPEAVDSSTGCDRTTARGTRSYAPSANTTLSA